MSGSGTGIPIVSGSVNTTRSTRDFARPTVLLARVAGRMQQEITATGDYFNSANVLQALNAAQAEMHAAIARLDANWFVEETDITLVVDQSDYSLPPNCLSIKRVCPFGTSSNVLPYEFYPLSMQGQVARGVTFIDDALRLLPSPQSAGTIRLTFVRFPSAMHYGTAASGTSETITLPAAPTLGETSLLNDAYNGAHILTTGGTGAGQMRKITDYDADTRACTVDTAWTTNPDATTTYEILSCLWQDEAEAMVLNAMARLMANDTDMSGWMEQFSHEYNVEMARILKIRGRRQTSNNLKWHIKW